MGESHDKTGAVMKKLTELPGLFNVFFIVFRRCYIDGACRADFSPQLSTNQTATDSGLKSALQNTITQKNMGRVLVGQQRYHNQYTYRTIKNFLLFWGLSFDY
jgi:hypothetical protein